MRYLTATPLLQAMLVLTVLAGHAAAQTQGERMGRQRYGKGGEASIDDAVKEMSSSDADKRLEAVKTLGTSKNGKAIDYLLKAVGDPDVRVQAKAIQELGDIRAREATPVLTQKLLLHADVNMQQLLLASLGKIGDSSAAPAVMEFLRRPLDVATRATAIYALGDMGAYESTDLLEHIAQSDEDQTVRRVAREAIGKIQGPHAVLNNERPGSSDDASETQGLPPLQRGAHQ